jgi:Sulfotransferase family
MTDAPLFIVGCPRSGTTLLRRLLNAHPRLGIPPESHFIPHLHRGYGDPRTDREAVALAARILRLRRVRDWGLHLDPAACAADRTYGQVVARVYRAWASERGKARWGDKTPQYAADIPVLLDVFPDARIIHIIRDGRDVALSLLGTRFGAKNVFVAAQDWKYFVTAGRRAGASLARDTYHEIRYEALLAAPAETMAGVCAFIGEPFTDAVLRPALEGRHPNRHRVRLRSVEARRRGFMPHRTAEIVQANAGKWKRTMSRADRVLFESVAGDLLATLGYETEGVRRPIPAVERAWWRAHHAACWTLARLNTAAAHSLLWEFLLTRWADLRGRWRQAGSGE